MTIKEVVMGLIPDANETQVEILISAAVQEFKDFTRRVEIEPYESLIAKMVICQYNRLGSEGLNSESYSGVSYSYTNEYPEQILDQLKHCRKIGVIND